MLLFKVNDSGKIVSNLIFCGGNLLVFCRIWVNHHQQGMSNFWKGILKQLESFLTCTEIMVGDGKEAAFWRDYWSSDINSVNY